MIGSGFKKREANANLTKEGIEVKELANKIRARSII